MTLAGLPLRRLALLIACGWLLPVAVVKAGSFVPLLVGDENRVVHPFGYDGTGGTLSLTVCIDPGSLFASEMVVPLQAALETWNQLNPVTGNYYPSSPRVPVNSFDYQSVVLHELGHCLGIGHVNIPLFGFETRYTSSLPGTNGQFNTDPGPDFIQGSADDHRGDDINLHWFQRDLNSPFTLPSVVDITTYSRDLMDLPLGNTFVVNANPVIGPVLGFPNTEAVMYSTISPGEERRALTADDVATLRYGMSGLDEIAGTTDDYIVNLEYVGMVLGCDIVLRFDPALTGAIGRCMGMGGSGGVPISGNHFHTGPVRIDFLPVPEKPFGWYFSGGPDLGIVKNPRSGNTVPGGSLVYVLTVENTGSLAATGVVIQELVPMATTFDAQRSHPDWKCSDVIPGSSCSLQLGDIDPSSPAAQADFAVIVAEPLPPGVTHVSNTAMVEAGGNSPADENPSNNAATALVPIQHPFFGDGFEGGQTGAWTLTFVEP